MLIFEFIGYILFVVYLFYIIFRNTVRYEINAYKNIEYRKRIENIIDSADLLYHEKLDIIKDIITELITDIIEFSNYTEDIVSLLKDEFITSCINNTNKL